MNQQTRMFDADLCRRQAALFEDDARREADVAIQAALLNMSQGCGCLAKQLDWIGTMRTLNAARPRWQSGGNFHAGC